MAADPKPNNTFRAILPERTIADTYSSGPQQANLLEPQRRMSRIFFEDLKISVSLFLYRCRQKAIVKPKIRRGEVLHNSLHLPNSNSASALSKSLASFPDATSCSIWASHCEDANSSSQRVNALSSVGLSFCTSDSSSARLMRIVMKHKWGGSAICFLPSVKNQKDIALRVACAARRVTSMYLVCSAWLGSIFLFFWLDCCIGNIY